MNKMTNKLTSLTAEDYKIVPGVGFGKIKFGMTQDQVLEILGQPDEKEVDANYGDSPEDKVTVFYYDTLGFSISFDKEFKYRLTEISFDGPDFLLENEISVCMPRLDVLNTLATKDYDEPTEEDLEGELDETNQDTTAFTYEDKNVTLWFDADELGTIQIGPFWIDADTVKWPK